jgi:hypothetical protein
VISLHPRALNADFQHFISRFNNISYFMDTPERRVWGERRLKDRGGFTNNFNIYIYPYTPPNLLQGAGAV